MFTIQYITIFLILQYYKRYMSFHPTQAFPLPELPPQADILQRRLLPWMLKARTELGELKGYSHSLSNPQLLLSPAILRESVASSSIENINTTLQSILEQQMLSSTEQKPENKEVLRYRDAVIYGFESMKDLPIGHRLIQGIHRKLLAERSHGFRKIQNHIENSSTGKILYTPPAAAEISRLMTNWENFIHNESEDFDPLVKCAISHYQFEAIHPFADGNGRTGRILMVLYLIKESFLDYPVLYISGYINESKKEYYRLLHEVSTNGNWTEFIEYILKGIYLQAKETKLLLLKIMELHQQTKADIRYSCPGIYSADLVEQLFITPIVTPVRLGAALGIHYTTATRQLKQLVQHGFLTHRPMGKYQLYIHHRLLEVLNHSMH
jgi:Fic family protein